MKLFLRSLAVFTVILFARKTASVSVTSVDGIRIVSDNGSIDCDSVICPEGTDYCRVTKQNSPSDHSKIIRTRRCYSNNGTVLVENSVTEDNIFNANVNVNVVSGGGVFISNSNQLTPEEQEKLEQNLRETQERIQAQVSHTLNNLNQSLRPLLDGSFATNLQNHIQAQVKENLKYIPRF